MNSIALDVALRCHAHCLSRGLKVNPDIVTVIDYSLPSSQPRLFVVDVQTHEPIMALYSAHGSNSGELYAKKFSNVVDSHKSSIGCMRTGITYQGKHGLSLKLHGMEPGFNSNVFRRYIVVHGADYVGANYLQSHPMCGRSWGCIALDNAVIKELIRRIDCNSLIVSYYPDHEWLTKSKILN